MSLPWSASSCPSAPTALTCLTKHRRYADKGASPSSRTSAWHTGHARCSPHQYCSANSSTNAARHVASRPAAASITAGVISPWRAPYSRLRSMSAGASVSATSLGLPNAASTKQVPGRRPLRVEQARWRQGLGQRGALRPRRAVQRARERRDIRRVAAAGGSPRGVRSGSRSCSGSRRIEGIKKHAHRQRVLARPARALILGVPGQVQRSCAGSAPSAIR